MTGHQSASARAAEAMPEPGTMATYLDCQEQVRRCQIVTVPYRKSLPGLYLSEYWLVNVRVEGESEPRPVAVERVEVVNEAS
jgi:hypothetical protein